MTQETIHDQTVAELVRDPEFRKLVKEILGHKEFGRAEMAEKFIGFGEEEIEQ